VKSYGSIYIRKPGGSAPISEIVVPPFVETIPLPPLVSQGLKPSSSWSSTSGDDGLISLEYYNDSDRNVIMPFSKYKNSEDLSFPNSDGILGPGQSYPFTIKYRPGLGATYGSSFIDPGLISDFYYLPYSKFLSVYSSVCFNSLSYFVEAEDKVFLSNLSFNLGTNFNFQVGNVVSGSFRINNATENTLKVVVKPNSVYGNDVSTSKAMTPVDINFFRNGFPIFGNFQGDFFMEPLSFETVNFSFIPRYPVDYTTVGAYVTAEHLNTAPWFGGNRFDSFTFSYEASVTGGGNPLSHTGSYKYADGTPVGYSVPWDATGIVFDGTITVNRDVASIRIAPTLYRDWRDYMGSSGNSLDLRELRHFHRPANPTLIDVYSAIVPEDFIYSNIQAFGIDGHIAGATPGDFPRQEWRNRTLVSKSPKLGISILSHTNPIGEVVPTIPNSGDTDIMLTGTLVIGDAVIQNPIIPAGTVINYRLTGGISAWDTASQVQVHDLLNPKTQGANSNVHTTRITASTDYGKFSSTVTINNDIVRPWVIPVNAPVNISLEAAPGDTVTANIPVINIGDWVSEYVTLFLLGGTFLDDDTPYYGLGAGGFLNISTVTNLLPNQTANITLTFNPQDDDFLGRESIYTLGSLFYGRLIGGSTAVGTPFSSANTWTPNTNPYPRFLGGLNSFSNGNDIRVKLTITPKGWQVDQIGG
jgi:hypothetical protein